MKIVLVIDQFDDANNGTTISARRFAQALKNHGNEVRVIATGKPADYKYAVRQMRFFPVVEHLITSQGMRLAIPNRHVFEKAAAWADVVHFMMPSPLGIMGLKHVEKLGIPHTAAFHCQPENITFTLHMGNSRRVNDFVYNRFRDTFFNRFTHIHCPSNMIANQLRQHGYTARLHVISNGISPEYIYGKREKEPWMQGLFNVLMVGRYAGEKRQDELIDACAKSRHAREIQVILAGKGPLEKKYRRLAEKQLKCALTEEAKQFVIDAAYDPQYGARPLRRYLQHTVETLLAKRIVKGDITPNTTLTVSVQNGALIVD